MCIHGKAERAAPRHPYRKEQASVIKSMSCLLQHENYSIKMGIWDGDGLQSNFRQLICGGSDQLICLDGG